MLILISNNTLKRERLNSEREYSTLGGIIGKPIQYSLILRKYMSFLFSNRSYNPAQRKSKLDDYFLAEQHVEV